MAKRIISRPLFDESGEELDAEVKNNRVLDVLKIHYFILFPTLFNNKDKYDSSDLKLNGAVLTTPSTLTPPAPPLFGTNF